MFEGFVAYADAALIRAMNDRCQLPLQREGALFARGQAATDKHSNLVE